VKRALLIALVSSLAACNSATRSAANGDKEDVNPADRKILGVPAAYPADASLRGRQAELDGSMAARRAVAWATVRKVLQPVALADPGVPSGGVMPTVPRFQTWYAKDDFVRMWKELYRGLGTDGRKARAPLGATAVDAIFDWNAHMVDALPTWPADRYAEYVARLKTDEDWMAEGAGHRVSYSPAVMTHLFDNYGRVLGCMNGIDAIAPDAAPIAPDNFTTCFDSELPIGAAVVKAQWRRAEFGAKLPTFDTSADALARRWDAGADWAVADAEDNPAADRIHTVRLANGNVFRLVGLHVITKELRKWLWVTMWWAPDGDGDFGADRPADLEADPIFRHYKMCVVSSHDERDPAQPPGPTWCSNPYLERGAGNARTNCIGCHQHGGTSLKPETIIGDETLFPANGRTELRANFPTDYSWALTREDNLARIVADEVAYYDSFEK
jgi:hypothetical protein